jgi:hypothetical protein
MHRFVISIYRSDIDLVGKFTGKTHTETMNRRSYTINEEKLIVKGVARWGYIGIKFLLTKN